MAPQEPCGRSLSVVVPVFNEVKFIERTLTQLVTQRYDPQQFEVIVVDGQSTDGTPALVAEFAQRHLFGPLGIQPQKWGVSVTDVGYGGSEMFITARDMARFGQLYLDGGVYQGQ